MEIDTEKLESLLAENKSEEAKALLEAYFKQPLTDEEKGALYTYYAQVYLEVTKKIQEEYIESLRQIVSDLESLDAYSKGMSDKIQLGQVRAELND